MRLGILIERKRDEDGVVRPDRAVMRLVKRTFEPFGRKLAPERISPEPADAVERKQERRIDFSLVPVAKNLLEMSLLRPEGTG